MKKLNKLQINSGKLMKNEELVSLRGGYSVCTTICYTDGGQTCLGALVCDTGDCTQQCKDDFNDDDAYGIPSTCD